MIVFLVHVSTVYNRKTFNNSIIIYRRTYFLCTFPSHCSASYNNQQSSIFICQRIVFISRDSVSSFSITTGNSYSNDATLQTASNKSGFLIVAGKLFRNCISYFFFNISFLIATASAQSDSMKCEFRKCCWLQHNWIIAQS